MTGKSVASGRGRKPKPSARKQLAGNPGKRKINTEEPSFTQLVEASPPDWLDDIARGMWETIVPQLCREKVVAVTDLHNIEVFCCSYSNWRTAQLELSRNGSAILTDDNGKKYKHPAATIVNESYRQLCTFGALLGLDPSSRQRLIGGNKQQASNPFLNL
ncbi:phage terminase small subunit P27 family [Endozoicomonas sp. Mp262]|uniref:phage terminase small subunit P27 family n=1 Tax=Endozoicomonas sp. Mp262 TaxID=2919499 RepID=UPI0021DB305E